MFHYFFKYYLKVTSKLVNFIIDGNLSFNVAQLPSLRELLEAVSGRKVLMPTRHKFMTTLGEQFTKMKSTLREFLGKQKHLCLTTDVWSSRAQSYLGVTVHFLNASFCRESFVLAFKELKCRQTYKELAKALNDVFEDYGIKKSQITNIVTDGGSAFCKMLKMYGNSMDGTTQETCDEEDDEIFGAVGNIEADVIRPFMEDVNGELFASEIIYFETKSNATVSAPNDDEFEAYFEGARVIEEPFICDLPKQRRCVSHLLNLISKDFNNELDGMAKSSLVATVNKLHTLWVLTHRSSHAKSKCKEILGKCLLVPCETRWNSFLTQFKSATILKFIPS